MCVLYHLSWLKSIGLWTSIWLFYGRLLQQFRSKHRPLYPKNGSWIPFGNHKEHKDTQRSCKAWRFAIKLQRILFTHMVNSMGTTSSLLWAQNLCVTLRSLWFQNFKSIELPNLGLFTTGLDRGDEVVLLASRQESSTRRKAFKTPPSRTQSVVEPP